METLKDAFYEKFPRNHKILEYYETANKCECTWENLTKVRLQRYADFLKANLSLNTAKSYCSKLKTLLNIYSDEHEMPKGFEKVLNIRKDESEQTFLTTDEINRLIEYEPAGRSEWLVRNLFVIGCLTGARHSDYIRFTRHNFKGNNLVYVSIKTHHKTEVPLSDTLRRLITENEQQCFCDVSFSDVYFNRLIKQICRKAGINDVLTMYNFGKTTTKEKWKFVSSHTARRSFATNLYLHGVDLYTISQLCGHSSVEITKTYICCAPKIDDKVMSYLCEFK